jgi:hypothetical protein
MAGGFALLLLFAEFFIQFINISFGGARVRIFTGTVLSAVANKTMDWNVGSGGNLGGGIGGVIALFIVGRIEAFISAGILDKSLAQAGNIIIILDGSAHIVECEATISIQVRIPILIIPLGTQLRNFVGIKR